MKRTKNKNRFFTKNVF